MSNVKKTKELQGYVDKFIPPVCANCKNYNSEKVKRDGMFGGVYIDESKKRCSIGGFAVKKMGTCDLHNW